MKQIKAWCVKDQFDQLLPWTCRVDKEVAFNELYKYIQYQHPNHTCVPVQITEIKEADDE